MYRQIVVLVMILVMFSVPVWADHTPQHTQQQQQASEQNRFLSAEVQRQIRQEGERIEKSLQEYQDENFRILDQRMNELMSDTQIKVILGGIGAVLLANAVAAIFLIRTIRRYSYDPNDSKEGPGPYTKYDDDSMNYSDGFENMREQKWNPQEPKKTIGMEMGQEQASNMTQMNKWQSQPPYNGGWQSPLKAKPDYTHKRPKAGQQNFDWNVKGDDMNEW